MTRRGEGPFRALGEELDARLGEIMGELGRVIEEAADGTDAWQQGEFTRERTISTPRGNLQAGIRLRVGSLATDRNGTDEARAGGGEKADNAAPRRPVRRPRGTGLPKAPGDAAGNGDPSLSGLALAESGDPASAATDDAQAPWPVEATILDVDGRWTLVADLPGVGPEGVTIAEGEGGRGLLVEAQGRRRRYAGRFDLPPGLRAAGLSMSLVNGVLELHGEVPKP